MNWPEFQAEVMRRRECGEVIAAERIWKTPPTLQMVLQWLKDMRLSEAEEFPDTKLSLEAAKMVITDLLSFDMAYKGSVPSGKFATELTEQYFEEIVADAEFLTNGNYVPFRPKSSHDLGSWTPMTDATFDSGVISLHPTQTTVFWFLDED